MEPVEILKQYKLFHTFSKEELEAVVSRMPMYAFTKDELIHLQDEPLDHAVIPLEGSLAVIRLEECGHWLFLERYDKPQMIGAYLLFSDLNIMPMTLIAESDGRLAELSRELILDLCKNAGFLEGLLQEISNRSILIADRLADSVYKSIRERLMMCFKKEQKIQHSQTIQLPYSKQEMAARMGIARTSLSRELKKMEEDGLIEVNNRSIKLKESVNRS